MVFIVVILKLRPGVLLRRSGRRPGPNSVFYVFGAPKRYVLSDKQVLGPTSPAYKTCGRMHF